MPIRACITFVVVAIFTAFRSPLIGLLVAALFFGSVSLWAWMDVKHAGKQIAGRQGGH